MPSVTYSPSESPEPVKSKDITSYPHENNCLIFLNTANLDEEFPWSIMTRGLICPLYYLKRDISIFKLSRCI